MARILPCSCNPMAVKRLGPVRIEAQNSSRWLGWEEMQIFLFFYFFYFGGGRVWASPFFWGWGKREERRKRDGEGNITLLATCKTARGGKSARSPPVPPFLISQATTGCVNGGGVFAGSYI